MKKRLLSLLLFVVVGLSAVQAYDFSVVVPSGQTLYFTITSNSAPYTVEIILPQSKSSYIGYKKLTGNLVIPSTVTYQERTYNVTSIGDYAFNFCYGLTSVSIPNSVTAIGKYAFAYCICLASVSIPNSVTAIGDDAFYFVKHITYNGTATGSPWGARSVNGFVENGFVYNDSTKTTLQRYIGTDTNVIIPNGVTAIESNTFIDCHNLTSVTIPYGVTSIRDYAFAYCYGLTSINIPSGVIAIESNAFRDCFNLTSVIIPNSVATIGDDAFSGCSKLTSVSIPNSVTSIGDDAFYFVKHITYNGTATGSPWGARSVNGFVENGFVYNDSTKTTLQRYIGTDTNVIISNGVTIIGECAFEYCSLTTVTIPNSVTSIGDYAFYFCSSLTSVSIPNSVTSIGEGTFSDCLSLISVTISNGVTSIGKGAFYNSTRLTSVIIPNSVTSIGERAFSWVKNIIYNGSAIGSPWGALSHNGFVENGFVYSDNTKTSLLAYIGSDTNITIPNSVTSIGDWTFAGCNYLTSVTIPNSVTIIGRGAFSYCRGLTSITIPNGVTSIGDDAFEYCSSLTTLNFNAINCDNFSSGGYPFFNCPISTINIGDSVQQIPNNLIKHNTHLTTLTLGSNLTSIPANTFSACSSLQSVTCFSKTPPSIDSSVFPYPNTALLSVPHGSIESYSSPTSYWNMFFNDRISEN